MKSIFLKVILIMCFSVVYSCKAQSTADYINFYNDLVSKLNSIVPNKTQYYGQNFSNFYNELQNKNINIVFLLYDAKAIPGTKYYVLTLYFTENKMWRLAINNTFQIPSISITFQDEIPSQINQLSAQSHGRWNATIAQFFANMNIEKIEFVGINGYNNPDRTIK